jgi:preprotein translocase subunit SecG
MMTILFTILHILVCLFLILVVLAQQGKGQDLQSAFGGAGSQTAFGARGTATLLSKITAGAAAIFMITSLTLSFLRPAVGPKTVVPESPPPAEAEVPPPPPSEETQTPTPEAPKPETPAPQEPPAEGPPEATSTTPPSSPK